MSRTPSSLTTSVATDVFVLTFRTPIRRLLEISGATRLTNGGSLLLAALGQLLHGIQHAAESPLDGLGIRRRSLFTGPQNQGRFALAPLDRDNVGIDLFLALILQAAQVE